MTALTHTTTWKPYIAASECTTLKINKSLAQCRKTTVIMCDPLAIVNIGCLHYKLANSVTSLSLRVSLGLGLALVLAFATLATLAALAFRSCCISITDSRLFLDLLSVTREANQLDLV